MCPASTSRTVFGRADRVDSDDVARYDRLGDAWWDPKGDMAPLHKLNPTRIRYLRDLVVRHFAVAPSAVLPLTGLSVLDIGCGGGLLAEPLARLGGQVTGIDPAPGNIEVASRHAGESGVSIAYRSATAETLAGAGESFDVVLALEVVEHVPEPEAFVAMLAIVGAEYVLRWLPRGTHRWNQFRTPEEITVPIRKAGLKVIDRSGMVYDPLRDHWGLGRDMDVNYLIAAARLPSRRFLPCQPTSGS